MPGIHVRPSSRLDWENSNKKRALTIPGSNWLCHKNNIYKFTIKFHKTIRNVADFLYTQELMNVIRRVIKDKEKQLNQGQDFVTNNLRVTCNHASWTHQEKMFAAMKFCDRPDDIAFPHTFVLTVKVLSSEVQRQTENTMGASTTKPHSADAAKSLNDDPASERMTSKSSLEYKDEVDGLKPTNGHKEYNDKDLFRSLRSRSHPNDSDNSGTNHSKPSNLLRSSENCDRTMNDRSNQIDETSNNNDPSRSMECSSENPTVALLKTTSPKRSDSKTPIDLDEDSNYSKDSQSDTASLPYQYLIEKDIERELENSRNLQMTPLKENDATSANQAFNSCSFSVNNDTENDSKSSSNSRKCSRFRSRQESKDSETIHPDITNLRSSDITDLVMKGLMFTIRQDKDTVTVVEQKTKLELDEVLENSEKVETKEGDPCLLNSSLLRLEKMITRMQEPVSLPEQRHSGLNENALVSFIDLNNEINVESDEKLNEADVAERKEVSQISANFETANCWSHFFTDKDISDPTLVNVEKSVGDSSMYINIESENNDMELKIDDEEEDIIPEALVDNTFIDSALEAMSERPNSVDAFQDLLMDDIEPSDTKISDEDTSKSTLSNQPNNSTTNVTNIAKDSSKLPKVISNQIITNDQIPPALLRVLKHKSSNQHNMNEIDASNTSKDLSENNNEINVKNVDSNIEIKANTDVNKVEKICESDHEESVQSVVEDTIKSQDNLTNKNNEENYNESNSSNNTTTSESSFEIKPQRKVKLKHNYISTSDSSSIDNVRLTRSHSKLHTKPNELSTSSSILNEHLLKCEKSIEVRGQKTLNKNDNINLNKNINNKTLVSRKRRKSVSDQCASKFCKSVSVNEIERKEVKIKVWKLISDITYGVRVVVERMDSKNIPR